MSDMVGNPEVVAHMSLYMYLLIYLHILSGSFSDHHLTSWVGGSLAEF